MKAANQSTHKSAAATAATRQRKAESRGSAWPRTLVITAVSLLVCGGTVMVFSAAAFHWSIGEDTFYFLRKQLAWVAIASLAGLFFYQVDYRLLARFGWHILIVATLLLALVLIPGVGTLVNESRRWIRVGGLQFQPSELAKLAVIVFVASFMARDLTRRRRFFGGFVTACFAVLPAFVLVLLEPDFGTAVFILGLALMLLILGGMKLVYMLASAVVFLPMIALAVHSRWEEIRHRVLAFLEPEAVYQTKHSLTALGSGGMTGRGLGAGGQKLDFLPEAHTDFILAIVGEELGFLGSGAVLLLLVVLLWGGVGIIWRACDVFGFLLGAGIVLGIAVQAMLNVAVVTASAPTKGIALPFVTFGGSGLVMGLIQIGILLSIDRVWREEGAPRPAARAAPAFLAERGEAREAPA